MLGKTALLIVTGPARQVIAGHFGFNPLSSSPQPEKGKTRERTPYQKPPSPGPITTAFQRASKVIGKQARRVEQGIPVETRETVVWGVLMAALLPSATIAVVASVAAEALTKAGVTLGQSSTSDFP